MYPFGKSTILKISLVLISFMINADASIDLENGRVPVRMCYLQSWSVYRKQVARFTIDDIDPTLCTHIVYAFAGMNPFSNRITSLDPFNDHTENYGDGGYEKITNLKLMNPNLKVILSVGGLSEGSDHYSRMAQNQNSRQIFINSVISYLRKYNFDGLDLFWLYPTQRGGIPEDKHNFVLLAMEMKHQFRKYDFILTAAFAVNKNIIDKAYDIPMLSIHLDFINLLSYDYHGSWDLILGHTSPLHGYTNFDELNVEYTVNYLLKLGVAPEKLVLGIPFYGRTFIATTRIPNLENPTIGQTEVYSNGFNGPLTGGKGYIAYFEVCSLILNPPTDWIPMWDNTTLTPYVFKEDWIVSFENQQSIIEKIRFATNKNLAGVMVWSIEGDDFHGDCYTNPKAFEVFIKSHQLLQKSPNYSNAVLKIGYEGLHKFLNLMQTKNKAEKVVFPLLKTINEGMVIAQQEKSLSDAIHKMDSYV